MKEFFLIERNIKIRNFSIVSSNVTFLAIIVGEAKKGPFLTSKIIFTTSTGANAINISGLLNPKKLGNFNTQML